MVWLAISILVTNTAVKRYVKKQLNQGIYITWQEVYILVTLVTLYNLKTISNGLKSQFVKRREIHNFVVSHKLTNRADTKQLVRLIKLGYVSRYYGNYRPTAAGKLEVKKIGLFVERLVKDYHCQPEKVPGKKKE
tara:strand:- start:534 stop:938 length:405 start_codon:yes stop_codon:yes gene_type:complete